MPAPRELLRKMFDSHLAGNEGHCIATPQMALHAAASAAQDSGIPVHIPSDTIEGEARDIAKVIGAIALQVARATDSCSRRPAFWADAHQC